MTGTRRGGETRDWLDYLPRRIRSVWKGQVLAVVCLVVAFGLRWGLTPLLEYNGPFFTFFPAVMIAAVWGGPLSGFTTLAGGALLAAYFWLAPLFDFAVTEQVAPHLVGFLLVGGVVLVVAAVLRSLVDRQQAAEERALLLAQEMRHRVRNLMGLVIAISHQTGREAGSVPEFLDRFGGRMEALAAALALDPEGAREAQITQIDTLLARVLAPFGHERCLFAGPPLAIAGGPASALALVLHELATNAVKYGALSVPGGRVEIGWRHGETHIEVDWREVGGPPVAAPGEQGFGSRLIRSAFAQYRGEVRVAYEPGGVQCRIRF